MFIAETDDDCIDEGIDEGDKRWDDESEEERNDTKELEHIIEVGFQFESIVSDICNRFVAWCAKNQAPKPNRTNANSNSDPRVSQTSLGVRQCLTFWPGAQSLYLPALLTYCE